MVVVVTIVLCSTCVSVVWCAQNQYFKLRRGRVLGRGRMRQCTLLEAKRIHTTSCTTDMDEVAGDTTADLLSVGCPTCYPWVVVGVYLSLQQCFAKRYLR